MTNASLVASLALSCAISLMASQNLVASCIEFRAAQGRAAITTSEVEKDLPKKTKAEVKSYFGRSPDVVESPSTWEFTGSFLDPDSGKTFGTCRVAFSGDTCVWVRFY